MKKYRFIIRVFKEDDTHNDEVIIVRADSEMDACLKVEEEAFGMTRGGEYDYDFWRV